MATWYPLILLLHLSCAIVFVGAVAFEVLVLESLHRHFDHAIMERIEAAVMARVRRFMPVVVALLFLSGFALFDIRCNGFACIGSRFGWLLSIKVALAFGVLAVFVTAIRAGMRGTMDPCRFRRTHHVVLCLMAAIVVLAKLMFY
ncbi:MAG TPA: hypothetical protein VFF71_09135 [Luteimonas sp.]|nr:hypothetical protein [Luteimonas sp.]